MVAFSVPDVHLTGFPDGKYRVSAELTGNWGESRLQSMLGYRRIEPLAYYVSLTKDQHLVPLDFEVIHEPWRWRPGATPRPTRHTENQRALPIPWKRP